MIVLFTDFGTTDFYVGQMHTVLARQASGVRVIDLLHSVPNFDIRAGAYLLPVLATQFPPGTVFIGAVNQGRGDDAVVMVEADGRWFVGPDNGLFHMIQRRATRTAAWQVEWRPPRIAPTFHARDLYAPVAARLARGDWSASLPASLLAPRGTPWPDDLAAIIYIDHYGNAITGLRASQLKHTTVLAAAGRRLSYAPWYSAVDPGRPFWYANADGLAEISANQASAAAMLGLKVGTAIEMVDA
jgi:S-adenosyl-L-methionine hydrolase (adenosine-forming)